MLDQTQRTRIWCLPAIALSMTLPAFGGVLFDRAFFDGKPNTFIDFETLPDGTTLAGLTADPSITLAGDAYSQLGVSFSGPNIWVDVRGIGNAQLGVQFAHAQASSGDMLLATGGVSFTEPVRAFMLFAADESWGGDASFNIWFEDDTFLLVNIETHMQSISDPTIASDTFRFGVVGYESDLAVGITRVTFSSGLTFIDDLQFTVIPAPGVLSLTLPIALMGIRRGRR
jgi:hypothetical protein